MICGKIIYPDRASALYSSKGIKRDKRSTRSKKKPVQAYHCSLCGGWHLTSNKKKLKVYVPTVTELHTEPKHEPNQNLKIHKYGSA